MGSMIKTYRHRERIFQEHNRRNRTIIAGMVSESRDPGSRIRLERMIRDALLEIAESIEIHVPSMISILTLDSYKTLKSRDKGVTVTGISYMAPASRGPLPGTLCADATLACFLLCLDHAGKNGLPDAFNARRWKTYTMMRLSDLYGRLLWHELRHLIGLAGRVGLPPSYRSDGTTDVGLGCLISQVVNDGHIVGLEGLTFYDYTADPRRVGRYPRTSCQVTFSFKGDNPRAVENWNRHRADGDGRYGGIAVVYDIGRNKPLPEFDAIGGRLLRVINGDQHDARPWDVVETDEPHIVGLHYKIPIMKPEQREPGEAIARASGFLRSIDRVSMALSKISNSGSVAGFRGSQNQLVLIGGQ